MSYFWREKGGRVMGWREKKTSGSECPDHKDPKAESLLTIWCEDDVEDDEEAIAGTV